MEIFDYLEGFDLYQAFSNLNVRFENLLVDRSLHLKMKSTLYSDDQPHHVVDLIHSTRNQILSLKLSHPIFNGTEILPLTIDSSFTRLESLTLQFTNPTHIIPLLVGLTALPRLFSLYINSYEELDEIDNIYQIIFNIPMLKYNKVSFDAMETSIPLSIPTSGQFSRIEQLILDHPCALDELIVILSYTPQLRRLFCTEVNEWNAVLPQRTSICMSHLTHLSLSRCSASFDHLDMFIRNLSAQLQVIHLACTGDSNYLNGNQWQEIIGKYLTQLRVFDFQYEETLDEFVGITPHHAMITQFHSSFWTRRKWFLKIFVHKNSWFDDAITYSIGSDTYVQQTHVEKHSFGVFS